MKAKWGGGGGGGGGGGEEHEIFLFLKGENRNFSDVCWGGGGQFIFMNLNPIPGAPLMYDEILKVFKSKI